MAFDFGLSLLGRRVEYFDAPVLGRHINKGATLVEDGGVGGGQPRVELHLLFNHADVPDLSNSVAIRRDDAITL